MKFRSLHLFCAVFSLTFTAIAEEKPPNIVLLLSDDQAWNDYSFLGHPKIKTPRIDALAAQGAVFERGYVPTGLCRPSLMTLATGLYAHQNGIIGNDPAGKKTIVKEDPEAYAALREQLIANVDKHPTIMRMLTNAGYLTLQTGKWWEGNYQRGGFTHGMTRGFPEQGGRHGDDGLKIGREGIQEIKDFVDLAQKEDKPFYIWYAPFLPHTPHNPPQELFDKYLEIEENTFRARYYAMCEWFDQTIGDVVDTIDEAGEMENTLFVYLSDNGWIQSTESGTYALRSKQSPNEGGVRQPIFYTWKGKIKPGSRGEQLASSIDVVPTMLGAAGLEQTKEMPGIDLMSTLESGEATPRNEVLGETFAHDVFDQEKLETSLLYRWKIQGPWKLLLTYDGEVSERYAWTHPRTEKRPQLFNLINDPGEETNLASSHPDVVEHMARSIADWWPVTERKVLTAWEE